MIFSSRSVLHAMRPISLDDLLHYRPIVAVLEVSKESAGKSHLMVYRHLSGPSKEKPIGWLR